MSFVDRTNHQTLADQTAARIRAAAIADKYIPAVEITPTHNQPPEPISDELTVTTQSDADTVKAYADAVMAKNPAISAALDQSPLLKAFLIELPVIETAQDAQKAATWIEATRKTVASLEDERKPKTEPLNLALGQINGAYRIVREPLEKMLQVLRDRWNKWDRVERERREAEARRVREAAEEAERVAAEAARIANEAIADAEAGSCEDVGSAIEDADAAARDAGKLNRLAARAEKATHVRVASTLGGKAISSRRQRVIVIDDPCAAIKAIGLTDRIKDAIQQSAKVFEEATGELPAGTHEDFTRSI